MSREQDGREAIAAMVRGFHEVSASLKQLAKAVEENTAETKEAKVLMQGLQHQLNGVLYYMQSGGAEPAPGVHGWQPVRPEDARDPLSHYDPVGDFGRRAVDWTLDQLRRQQEGRRGR